MSPYLWIALGSAMGGAARFGVGHLLGSAAGSLPWGTFFVNVTGSFAIGFFNSLTGPEGRFYAPARLRQLVMIGLCGGYTTFSAFSLETVGLAARGAWGPAGLYVAASLLLGLLGVWLGHLLGAMLNRLAV